MRLFSLLILLLLACVPATSQGAVKTALHEYKEGETILEGYVAWDDSIAGPRPAVLVVHAWMGIGDQEREVADRLATMGYVAFCADIYGKGIRAGDPAAAGKLAGQYRGGDRQNYRDRLNAALNEVKTAFPEVVDPTRVVAIGYCFGGSGVLELARSNADVLGVVSFHGGLKKGDAPTPVTIAPRILVLHGDADPAAPPEEVAALQQELRETNANWELVLYSNVVHSFTNKNANSPSSRYDALADARSWKRLEGFLDELFAR